MNAKRRSPLIFVLALLAGMALAVSAGAGLLNASAPLAPGGSPEVVAYQGEVRVDGTPYTGDGYFKFAVVNKTGSTSYWSNDGTSTGGGQPTAAVKLDVSDGLFGVLLGDTTLDGMTRALAADVFDQPDRYLRGWFSTSESGTFDLLAPDSRIATVPYALQAQAAVDADTVDGEHASAFADAIHGHAPGDISPQGATSGLDADTVDGLHASQLQNHYQNVIVVSKSGGDYTSVQAAVDSINDAAAGNTYLIWIAPGVFEEQVALKPHIHLQGAGQEATIITSTTSSGSAWPPTQATLVLASDTSLRDLTVGNNGSGDVNAALLATTGTLRCLVADVTARALGDGAGNPAIVLNGSGTDIILEEVDALADYGSNYGIGLLNMGGAVAMLRGGSFVGRGGNYGRGIFALESGTTLVARDVSALGENGSTLNVGLSSYGGAAAVLRGGIFVGRGGDQTGGVSNSFTSTLTAQDITVLAENGVKNYGLGNYRGATMTVHSALVTARGGTNNYALSNERSVTLDAESVTALAEGGSGSNHGMWNANNAQAKVHGGSFTGRGGTHAYGIHTGADDSVLEVHGVTALGEDGNDNYGLWNTHGEARLYGGSFTARGGNHAEGICNLHDGATLEADYVTALGEDGADESHGLGNSYGTVTLRGGAFTGRGGAESWGIYNGNSSATLDVVGVATLGVNGSESSYGVHNFGSATANITHSRLEGATHSVFQSSGPITVSHSLLAGEAATGTITCVAVSRGSTFSAGSCP